MKCPFELPAEKYEPMKIIRDAKMNYLCDYKDDENADYILQAINCHEKIKEHIENIDNCLAIMANQKSEEGIRDLPKLINNLWEYVQQALKEAEKL